MGCSAKTMERLDAEEPVLLLEDADDQDLESLKEGLVWKTRRGIGCVDSCEGCGVLDVWSGVPGGSKIAEILTFSLILRSLDHTGRWC